MLEMEKHALYQVSKTTLVMNKNNNNKNVEKKMVLNTDVMILTVDSDCYIYYLIV